MILELACIFMFPAMSSSDDSSHVVVVGAGLAGLSAAIEASIGGVKVTVIDGEPKVGGNSAKASSGISGCPTSVQEKLGIQDSPGLFYRDTMSAGDNMNDQKLVNVLALKSGEAVEWLRSSGVELDGINILGGHSRPRTHWILTDKGSKPRPIGVEIIKALQVRLQGLVDSFPNRVKILLATKMVGLETSDSGAIVGVKVRSADGTTTVISCSHVVLATGGFGNDHTADSLLKEFAPQYLEIPTTNGPFAQGSGVKLGRSVGAKLVGMEYVQIHPTGFVDPKDPKSTTKFLAAEALRGSGALLLDQKGARFVNELDRRDYTTEKIFSECSVSEAAGVKTAWLVMNTAAVDKFGWPAFDFYMKIKGFFQEVQNASELARRIDVDEEVFKNSIDEYNQAARGEKPDIFGKKIFPVQFSTNEPLYFASVTPSIHYTMGGLAIDENAHVLAAATGQPLKGLLAAGEVSGGVHGSNRLGGNSLLECVVFGRIAGQTAAGEILAGLSGRTEL